MLPLPLSPFQASAIIGLISFVAGSIAGWKVEHWRWRSEDLDKAIEAQQKYAKAVEDSTKVEGRLQVVLYELEGKRTVLLKELHHETERVEYRCILPDAGRMLYNRAAGGDPTVAAELPARMPPPSAATRDQAE